MLQDCLLHVSTAAVKSKNDINHIHVCNLQDLSLSESLVKRPRSTCTKLAWKTGITHPSMHGQKVFLYTRMWQVLRFDSYCSC